MSGLFSSSSKIKEDIDLEMEEEKRRNQAKSIAKILSRDQAIANQGRRATILGIPSSPGPNQSVLGG
jgi:hypothetical protein